MGMGFRVLDYNDRSNRSSKSVEVFVTETPLFEARLATTLVEKWGMVSGEPDGEDSNGRQKLRLLTPAEVVQRACETAQLMAEEARQRGWMLQLPDLNDLNKPDQSE